MQRMSYHRLLLVRNITLLCFYARFFLVLRNVTILKHALAARLGLLLNLLQVLQVRLKSLAALPRLELLWHHAVSASYNLLVDRVVGTRQLVV